MAKVLLITLYEIDYIGTRVLLSYLKENGHEVHNIHLKMTKPRTCHEVIEENHAFQIIHGSTIRRRSIDENHITKIELQLLSNAIEKYQPDIVGVSARTLHKVTIPQIMPILKELSNKPMLICGGYGPSLEPEVFFRLRL